MNTARIRVGRCVAFLPIVFALSCGEREPAGRSETTSRIQEAAFVNGDFEAGANNTAPPSWTVTPYLNPSIIYPPQSFSDLRLAAGGSPRTVTLVAAGGAETQADTSLGAGASLRWPKYGTRVAIVNQLGASNSANSLKQTMTIGASDVDPVDNKAHVRFTIAPVLQNPGHATVEQPYYWVQLRNLTKNTTLYQDFNASAQPGIPWKTSNGIYYTDWQLVDIAPGNAALSFGDQVQLEVIAAGCSQGGHWGHVYVDGVGAKVPGLFVSATGPSAANAGSNITYSLSYSNGGTASAAGTTVAFNTPPNTTWVGFNAPGVSCTTPAVGATGLATCTIGTLNPGSTGTLDITVRINNAATGTITNGNYSIYATGVTPLLGPKVYTTVTAGAIFADLRIVKSNGTAGVGWGQNVTYTITASNAGPTAVVGATVTDTMPAQFASAAWTCAGSNGGTCVTAAGSGNVNTLVNLPVGASTTLTLNTQIIAGSGTGAVTNAATITPPTGITESNNSNNTDADSDPIGTLLSVSVTKSGTGLGSIVSSPSAINCGTGCTNQSGSFLTGATVVLNALPGVGDAFAGWGGDCAAAGTATQCTLTVSAARNVTASFNALPKPNGAACADNSGCASGNCVDGVCCNTACGAGVTTDCQSCNVSGSVGTCTTLTASTTCRASAGVCDVAETCNGSSTACPADTFRAASFECRAKDGVCDAAEFCTGTSASCPSEAFLSASTSCRTPSCAAGVGTLGANCTGSSRECPAVQTNSCGDYLCGATACNTTCATDAACAASAYCNAGTCVPKGGPGVACSAGNACVSGFCADGVCCNSGCTGQCQACDVSGSVGTCTAVTGAPHGTRTACAANDLTCAGSCDGVTTNACTYPGGTQECRAASCSNGVATVAASCNGAGSCPALVTQSCAPYACGASACLTGCGGDGDCASGNYCAAGACVPVLVNGTACSAGNQCASGNCVDGVCCNGACGGQCEACDVAGSLGLCTAASGAPHGDRPACSSDGGACGGSCNGVTTNACTYPSGTQECRAASCSNGVATVAASCNGAGSCPALVTQNCAPFVCGATACLTGCGGDADCESGNYCAEGACVPVLDDGTECGADNQCASGSCVDGVCCDFACEGQCEACDVAGALGVCTLVSGAPHGERPACAAGDATCAGTCDGDDADACSYPAADVECRGAACANGVATIPASCNGAGSCPVLVTQACAPYECGASACLTGCAGDVECASGNYCAEGACVPVLDEGAECSADNECASESCVDGVCCDTACDGQCEACDVSGSVGTCVAVTGAPHGERPVCAANDATCAGSCNGELTDACAYPGEGVACRAASCVAGTATLAASCDAAGSCAALVTQACAPYACGTSACLSGCGDDGDCASGSYCAQGACVPVLDSGTACSASNQCASGNCVDGVCCNRGCGGQCEACDVTGSVGTCTAVTGAPRGERLPCAANDSACAGSCDGELTTACAYPGTDVECRGASCSGGTATLAASCDGAGSCPAPQTQDCGQFVCGETACLGDCTLDANCSSGNYCSGGVCVPELSPGTECGADNQCASGNCVDGVCCDTGCGGQCEACDVAGSVGTCTPVTGAPHGTRPACFADDEACAGSCDGEITNACAYPGEDVACREASCAEGVATLAAGCDGAGACPLVQTRECDTFVCGEMACLGDCTVEAHCSSGNYCSGGVCVPELEPGTECAADHQCASGNCVDGVCCDTACTGQCEACDAAGAVGTCTPVVGAPHGARPACEADDATCAGSCDGRLTSACIYPESDVECRSASCEAGTATLAAGCDGAGACPVVQRQECGEFVCGETACLGDCTVDSECVNGRYCSGGVCVPELDPGDECSTNNQCASGNCVDGVCCDSVCTGQCEACDVSGSLGTCTAVTGAPRGTRVACADDNSGCGGTCDGEAREACSYPSEAVLCRQASCEGGVATLAAACDGAGSCPVVQTQDCGQFVCGATACLGDCTVDGSCAGGNYCSGGVCVPALPPGSECLADNQCASGSCVDGVCCDTACEGQCEACDVPGSVGTCSLVTGAPHGGRAPCGGWNACAGVCDGANSEGCAFPGETVECTSASCSNGAARAASVCGGDGECVEAGERSCDEYACAGDVCGTSCEIDAHCAEGLTCSGGDCVAEPGSGGAAGGSGTGATSGEGGVGAAGGDGAGAVSGEGGVGGEGAGAISGEGGVGAVSGDGAGANAGEGGVGATDGAGGAGATDAEGGAGAVTGAGGSESKLPKGVGFSGGGCGCRTAGGRPAPPLFVLVVLFGAVTALRRRSRERQAA